MCFCTFRSRSALCTTFVQRIYGTRSQSTRGTTDSILSSVHYESAVNCAGPLLNTPTARGDALSLDAVRRRLGLLSSSRFRPTDDALCFEQLQGRILDCEDGVAKSNRSAHMHPTFVGRRLYHHTPIVSCTSTLMTTANFLALMHPSAPSQKTSTCRHVDDSKPSERHWSDASAERLNGLCRTPCPCSNVLLIQGFSSLLQQKFSVNTVMSSYRRCLCLSPRSSISFRVNQLCIPRPLNPDRTLNS